MGNCCPIFSGNSYSAKNYQPLLSNTAGRSRGTGTGPPPTGGSARRYRATDPRDPIDIAPMTVRPVKVPIVDKQIIDHVQLFNEHIERRINLLEVVRSLKEKFPESEEPTTLKGCFKHLRTLRDDQSKIKLIRNYQYCIAIEYEKDINQVAIECFKDFNTANKLIKDIMDKGQPLVNSVEMVINNERQLRREVLVASLGEEGPQCMKNCMENVTDLKKVASIVDDIRRETTRTFDELKQAAAILFAPEETENSLETIYRT